MLDQKEFEKLVGKENLDKIFEDKIIRNTVENLMQEMMSIPKFMIEDKMFYDTLDKYFDKRKDELAELIKTRIGIDMKEICDKKKEPVKN